MANDEPPSAALPPQSEETPTEEPEEPKKRRYGPIALAVLILGAAAGAGAYFGTRKTEAAAPPGATAVAPSTGPPTDPPEFKYPEPSEDDCKRIEAGFAREPKSDIIRNYELTMNVELSDQDNELPLTYLQSVSE